MSDLTVFVVPDGDLATQVREVVEAWSGEDLVGDSVWVTTGGIERTEVGPPHVRARVIAGGSQHEEDLFEVVGRRRLELVRVVVAHLVTLEVPADPELVELGALVARTLADALPRSEHDDTRDTRLHQLNAIVPASGVTGLDRDTVMLPGWDVNVVVSPEDRPDLDRSSIYVRAPGNFAGHAAASLAAIGGILRGVSDGALDLTGADSSSYEHDLVLARTSVRAVVGDDVVRRLTARAVEEVRESPTGAAAFVDWGRPAADPVALAARVVKHLRGMAPWAPQEPVRIETTARSEVGFVAVLRQAARFNLATFRTVGRWVLGFGRTKLEDAASRHVVGSEADLLVRLEPRPADVVHAGAVQLVADHDRTMASDVDLRADVPPDVPDPTTWSTLRDVVLAVVDGGDLPAGLPEPAFAGVRELLPPAFVVGAPTDTYELPDASRLTPQDPGAASAALRSLDSRILAEHQALVAAHERVATARAAADEGPVVAPGGEPDVDPEIAARTAAVEGLSAERARLTTWTSRQARTVLWQLTDGVRTRRAALADERRRLDAEASATRVPPHEALVQAQHRLVRVWRSTLVLWLVAVVVAIVVLQVRSAAGVDRVWWIGGLTLAALVVLILGNHGFFRAMRAYARRVQTALDEPRRTGERRVYVAREAARLGLLLSTLTSWSHILGDVLHRPWSDVEERATTLTDEMIDRLPAAAAVARPVGDDENLPIGAVVRAVRLLHGREWATRRFEASYSGFRDANPQGDDRGVLAVDLDTFDSPHSPRQLFAGYWSGGDAAASLTEQAVSQVRRSVEDGDIQLPVRQVRRVGRYSDGETVAEPDFYRPSAGVATAFVTDAFSPVGLQGQRHYVQTSWAWLPRVAHTDVGAEGVTLRSAEGSVSLRVDVSRRLQPGELRMFGPSAGAADGTGSPVGDRGTDGMASELGDDVGEGAGPDGRRAGPTARSQEPRIFH